MLNAYKELTPVIYDDCAIKHYYTNYTPGGTCFRVHWHDRIEILYLTRGEIHLQLNGEPYSAQAGDVVIIGPRTLHFATSGPEGASYHCIMFDLKTFCNGTAASEKYIKPLFNPDLRIAAVCSHPELIASIERLLQALSNTKGTAALTAIGIVYEILSSIHTHCADTFRQAQKKEEHFRDILEYIHENYTSKISNKDISRHFNYNETYFCRRFKAITGMTTTRYIQCLRLEKALELLKHSDDDISTIAWKCGFSDISYFSNSFKKDFHCTPSEYRMQNTKK